MQFFNTFYDERNSAVNHDQNDTVFVLDNVYDVEEKNGGGLSYDIVCWTYDKIRKIPSKLQCNFE